MRKQYYSMERAENEAHINIYGVTYRCTRDTGAAVYHALADLVGLYVEVL